MMSPSITPPSPPSQLLTSAPTTPTTIITTNEETLEAIGTFLDTLSNQIDDLEKTNTLGPTITRACQDLASTIAALAAELDDNDGQQQKNKEFARAISHDANAQLSSSSSSSSNDFDGNNEAAKAIAEFTEEQLIEAVSDAKSLLLDVESVLRSIGQDEADEIAEVGLVVARMFIWALKDLHGVLLAPSTTSSESRDQDGSQGMEIEILDSDDDDDEKDECTNDDGDNQNRSLSQPIPQHDNATTSKTKTTTTTTTKTDRMRVLWPPIGPAVASAGKWGAESALKSPLLSIALSMTLWPAAIMTAFIGAPILATDYVLQKGYDAASDTTLLQNIEKGAANLYSVGKLYYLCGKLVLRQGWRVGERQIERRGGLGVVVQDLGGMAVERVLHPVETVGMAVEGAKWGVEALMNFGGFVRQVSVGGGPQPPLNMQ